MRITPFHQADVRMVVVTPTQHIPWRSLETRSATLLILAGLLLLVNVTAQVLLRVTAVTVPEVIRDLTLAAAGILAMLGLLGLVPRLREQAPWSMRAGSVFAGVAVIGLLAVAIGEQVLGGEQPPAWFAPLLILYLGGVPLSFLVFGQASLRTATPSRGVGAILVGLFVAFLVFFHLIPLPVEGLLTQVTPLTISAGLIATGYLIHTTATQSGRTDPAGDPTPR